MKTIGFLIVFVLFFHSSVFSQTSYLINGRTLMMIDSVYYDISGSDTIRVDHTHVIVKFKNGQEVAGNDVITSLYPIANIGKTVGSYYVYSLFQALDIVQFIISLNSNMYIDETEIQYIIPFQTFSFPNDPGGPHTTIWQGEDGPAWYLGREDTTGYPQYVFLDMLNAWEISTGDPSIKVAILDNGCDWSQIGFCRELG